jgi:hypothetical protein
MDARGKSGFVRRIFSIAKSGLLAFSIFELLTLIIVLTGFFDYWWIRYVVGQFDEGLGSISFANPFIPKCIVSAAAALFSFLYLRYAAFVPQRPRFLRQFLQYATTGVFGVATLQTGIKAVGTGRPCGAYFDELGHALVRYEITPENKPVFYSRREVSPRTGRQMQLATPAVVSALEARCRGECQEVQHPESRPWFAPGNGDALLWYSKEPDGWHFWTCPQFDPVTKQPAEEVTPEFSEEWHARHPSTTPTPKPAPTRTPEPLPTSSPAFTPIGTPPALSTPTPPLVTVTPVPTPYASSTPTRVDIYYFARIRNRTRWTIPYGVWDPERGWVRFRIAPGGTMNHVRKNVEARVKYNEMPRPRIEHVIDRVAGGLRSVGAEPSPAAREHSFSNYFELMSDGRVGLILHR